jgi:alpha-L-arabinofuranosidase
VHGFDSGFSRYGCTTSAPPFWSLVHEGKARGAMHLETAGGITEASSYCLRLDVESASGGRIGVANEGFFGIGVKAGETYALSLCARGAVFKGPLSIRLEDAAGNACSDTATVNKIGKGWQQFQATLKATKTIPKARLVITAGAKGAVWLDFVSLMPAKTWKNRPNGLRADLAQMIADLKPGFVRFPGGCVVEGGTVETAYDWKLTVGPVERRPERWGPWNYRRTHGLGLFEYFQFIEDIGAEPLWVGFDGQTCIFRERENVPMSEMGPVRDSFLDLVEYANGPADSKWGAQRAKAGHPAPFGLKLVEIGNENQGPEYGERYRFVHEAMKAKHPDLTCLADLSWTSRESMGAAQFDIEDQHYYNAPRWFISRFHEYDGRDRRLPPLYLGEVAVTSGEGGPLRGNLLAALAEGVFLLGCERNADAVRMVSYAPLLGHVEGRTELTGAPPPWHALIYFDGTRSFGTVSYYLWKLFAENRPDFTVQTVVESNPGQPSAIAGAIGVGTWYTTAEFKDVRVEKNGQVLYAGDFAQGDAGWRREGGSWSVAGGVYRQGAEAAGLSCFGDASWTDYTLTLKARKLGGAEGFLIAFGRRGEDKYWWNVGGWGNREHALEFNQTGVGEHVPGEVELNRWYDVKIELNDRRIRCYLDGKLVHDVTAPKPQSLFASAGRDEATGDLILKVINTSTGSASAALTVSGAGHLRPDAQLLVLTSGKRSDNNSLEHPTRVAPTAAQLAVPGPPFTHEFPASSLTVLRFKSK